LKSHQIVANYTLVYKTTDYFTHSDHIPFEFENRDKKYYGEENISPSMAIVLNQMFHYNLNLL
jgi:hypothetical protein